MIGRMLFQATLVIAALNLLSRFLGLGREVVIAHMFGATAATDAYLVALTLPMLFFAILSQALASVVVPVFTEYKARGEHREAWTLSANVINLLFVLLSALTVLGVLAAPLVVKIIAPGLSGESAALAAGLTRVMFPVLVFAGLATIFTGFLNANNIFGIPAFSGAVNNMVIIAGALTLGAVYGIHGLAYGTVLGMAAAALIQFPALRRAGFQFRFSFDWRHPGVQKLFELVVPVTIGITISQLYIVVDRFLASMLAEGSIAALNFGNKLIQLPVSLFVLALSTAVFPTLTTWVAEGRHQDVADLMRRALRIIIMTTVPAGVGLIILRVPIVQLLFERGAFDERATAMTAVALLFYSVGLVGFATNIILTRGFYAFQDTVTPVKLLAVNLFLNLILSIILMGPMAHGGLALASSLSALVNTILLVWYLERRLPGIWHAGWLRFGAAVLLASGVMAWATLIANDILSTFTASYGTPGLIVQVGGAIIVGVAAFTISCVALRFEEVALLKRGARQILDGVRRFLTARGR